MPLVGGQNLGVQFTLLQPGGADYAYQSTACPPGFENLAVSLVLCGQQPCDMKIEALSLNRTRCIFGSDKLQNFGKLCKCNNPTFSLLQSPIAGL